MKSTLAPLEGNKIKLSVEVEEAEFDRDIDAAFRKIAHEVRLPGFRPGKAPRRVLEARIGIAPAREQALRDAIPQYLAKAVREHDVDIIDTPQVDITGGTDDGPVQFDATIDVRPKVTVPGYGGLRIEVPSPIVSDDEVQAPIDNELRRNGDLVDVDRPAVRGDYVTLDLAAFREGDAVPGLNTEDWLYEIGRGWVAESFDDELVGSTAGDVVTFSAPPSGTDEPADFTVDVKKVQELQLPELTDEWVSENLGEFDTVEAWRDSIRNRLQATRAGQLRQAVVERTSSALAELVDDEPPQVLVQSELRGRLENMAMQFQAQGIGFEQYLAVTGQDPETFQSTMTEGATRAVKADLALRAVADAESLDIDDDELEAEYVRIAISVNQKPNQVRKAYEKNDAVADLTAELRKRKAFDWLLERVEIVDPDGKLVERSLVLPEYAGSDDDGDGAATDAAATDTHEEATA
jgi:trigger factor